MIQTIIAPSIHRAKQIGSFDLEKPEEFQLKTNNVHYPSYNTPHQLKDTRWEE